MTIVNVDTKAQWVLDQEPMWRRAADLLGGTQAMRAAGVLHLPQFDQEPAANYQTRLNSSFLTNYYTAMLKGIVGAMTAEEITVDKACKLPPEFLTNVDRQGRDLNTFAKSLLFAILTKGAIHILTDYPKNPGVVTAADKERLGLRPYWSPIQPDKIVDALSRSDAGIEATTHVRWQESESVREGFGRKTRDTVRVLSLVSAEGVAGETVSIEVWQRDNQDQFKKIDTESQALTVEGGQPLHTITISPILAERGEGWKSKAPLDDIAFKNIEHWQSSSDQRNILRVSRFPMLVQIGTAAPVTITGPGMTLHSQGRQSADHQEVKFEYIEPAGNGIAAGEKDLARIESEIEAMGIRMFTRSVQRASADAESDAAKDKSPLQLLAEILERGLTLALQHAAIWYGKPAEEGGQAVVPKDFGLSADDAKAIDAFLRMRQTGDLSRLTLWAELRARGFLKTSFKDKEELQRITDERASEGMEGADPFGLPRKPGDDPDKDDPDKDD